MNGLPTALLTGYVPGDELDVPPNLSLCESGAERALDPVTYEVLRHRLWSINIEHGEVLRSTSGSPLAVHNGDFNPTVLTATGEIVFGGPYIQFFSPIRELVTKWILEHRAENPGIEPGDVFLSNDPWVGTGHQLDVACLRPVFVGGELLCWVANTLHQYDVGGTRPVSFCYDATDVFDEPVPIPPIKIVEGDEIRRAVLDMYLRHSRLPEMLELDLKAQLAGLREATARIEELLAEYGAETVHDTFEKVIGDSETAFLDVLEDVPDGTWRARIWKVVPGDKDGARTGDGDVAVYPIQVQLTKDGDTLTFTDEGTAESGPWRTNHTYAMFRTAISSVVNPLLLAEQRWVSSGAYRHIDIDLGPGSINRAAWPDNVSTGATNGNRTIALIQNLVVRMLSASPTGRERIATSSITGHVTSVLSGTNQWGGPLGTIISHVGGAGMGARADRDGIDTGGMTYAPKARDANIEQYEEEYPILYLYKRESRDAMGHGEYRGGAGEVVCFKPHGTDDVEAMLEGHSLLMPTDAGMSSIPPAPVRSRLARGTTVDEWFEERYIPTTLTDVTDRVETCAPRSTHDLDQHDLLEKRYANASGYGDPLQRDSSAVAADVRDGLVTRGTAADVYGVVLLTAPDGDIAVDGAATAARRETIRERRLAESSLPADRDEEEGGGVTTQIHRYLGLDTETGTIGCSECGATLCDATENYREHAAIARKPVEDAGPAFVPLESIVDTDLGFEFRQFVCPDCAVLFDVEFAREDDPFLHDLEPRLE
jgi:N-methylhydantoinase B